MSRLDILKWNERDILNSIEKEKQKPQDDLTKYYIKNFEVMLEDIQKQIKEIEQNKTTVLKGEIKWAIVGKF